jgi:peptide/nickel transport system substrate-binding protein
VTDNQKAAFFRHALSGRMDRRQVIETGLKLGIATPLLTALAAMPAVVKAAPAQRPAPIRTNGQEIDSGTLTVVFEGGTSDIDPHSSYTTLGSMVCLGCYEMLVQYKGSSTFEYAPMLAESWETSADLSTYTFTLPANVLFQDGTVCDAEAVRSRLPASARWSAAPTS